MKGNDNIFAVTNQRSNILKFTLSDWEGNKTYATFEEFWIEDESRLYTLHVNGYRGTSGMLNIIIINFLIIKHLQIYCYHITFKDLKCKKISAVCIALQN